MKRLIRVIYRSTNGRTVVFFLSVLVLMVSAIDPLFKLIENRSYLIAGAIITMVLLVLFVLLYPVLHFNDRNTFLLESIREVGLYDIENRAVGTHQYLPEKFFVKAKKEILILALTANTTFVEFADLFKKLIKENAVRVKVIILYPDKSLIAQLDRHDPDKIIDEINQTIKIIESKNLYSEPGFEIKFMKIIPPYTGVLIDGDVDHISTQPFDSMAELRIQPSSIFENQHAGVIIHFLKTDPKTKGVFEFFASDLRSAWKKCERHPELFELRHKK